LKLTDKQEDLLVAFLKTLTDGYAQPEKYTQRFTRKRFTGKARDPQLLHFMCERRPL